MSSPIWTRRGFLAAGLAVGALAGCSRHGVDPSGPSRGPTAHPGDVAATGPKVGTFVLGLNVSGLEDPVPAGPTGAMLDAYAAHGIRQIRLPGGWQHFQPRLGGPLDQDYLALYRQVVQAAGARKMSVVVDACHNIGHRDLVSGADETKTATLFADFWRKLVTALGDERAIIGWDLMNEPDHLGESQRPADRDRLWTRAAQQAITAVRSTGDKRTIKVEGCGRSSAQAWPVNNPTLHRLTDHAHKLVYSAHCYLDRDNSGEHAYWDQEVTAGDHVDGGSLNRQVGVRRMTPYVAWLRAHGLIGEIGECGVGRRDAPGKAGDSGWLGALNTTLAYCRTNGLAFFYWGTGPHLGAHYALSLEPSASGKPAPQWRVLDRYL